MFRGGPTHPGTVAVSAPRQFTRVKWKFATGDRLVGSPVLSDGVLYFGSDDHHLYAIEAETGRQLWRFATRGPVPSTPAVADGLVFAPSYDGGFYALDARDGSLRWKFATGGERRFEARGLHGQQPRTQTYADVFDVFLSSPAVAGGTVYFGSGDTHVYALDAASGRLRWKFKTDDVVHASPAVADGVVYIGSWDSRFYALDAATGAEKWRFQAGRDDLLHNQVGFQSSPAVADGVVYTGCRDAHLYALEAASGRELWRFNNEGSWVISSPAVAHGRVYFGTSDSALFHVVDAGTGKSLVKQKSKSFMFSSPVVAGDVVLIGVLNGTLEARDLSTGELLWTFQSPAARENPYWALTSEGRLNGPMIFQGSWREATTLGFDRQVSVGSIFATPLVAKGVVYVASADGHLYALE
ncbi:MAG: PQQ-binding-like beta-propeller repeat protein [Verrucomicrobia bacterium]|nr:PQQ-binding-like beta-propeller repeat protein [Verrucomicrobiota bacterium]